MILMHDAGGTDRSQTVQGRSLALDRLASGGWRYQHTSLTPLPAFWMQNAAKAPSFTAFCIQTAGGSGAGGGYRSKPGSPSR